MLINKTCLDAALIFSPKFQHLVRREGAQCWIVYVAVQLLQHSQDGKPLAFNDLDLIACFSGLDIEQVNRAVQLLIEREFLLGGEQISNASVIEDMERLRKKREIYAANGLKGAMVTNSKNKGLAAVAAGLPQLSSANLLNTEPEPEHLNTELIRKEESEEKTLPAIVKRKGPTCFDVKTSISPEEYQELLADPSGAAGDKAIFKRCLEGMSDWALSNGKKKHDWVATLRGWVRRTRDQAAPKPQLKSFQQIADEEQKAVFDRFLSKK